MMRLMSYCLPSHCSSSRFPISGMMSAIRDSAVRLSIYDAADELLPAITLFFLSFPYFRDDVSHS